MNKKRSVIKVLLKKELLDVLRDKKTVFMMIALPVFLYPAIFFIALQVMSSVQTGMENKTYKVAVQCNDDGELKKYIDNYNDDNKYKIKTVNLDEKLDDALRKEKIDAYIISEKKEDKLNYSIVYISSVTNSSVCMEQLEDIVISYRKHITSQLITNAGMDADMVMEPINITGKDIASNEESLGQNLSTIIPFILIISLIMGTMYPAIDTTAGEKERGTLETLLTLPVSNRVMITSKFLAVAIIGLISATLNILSMGGIAIYSFGVMNISGSKKINISIYDFIPALIILVFIIFAFTLFISAITMCVAALAKTYKEANNYITPLTLCIMLIGYIGFIPNIKLTNTMALIPVANICILIKSLLLFKINYTAIILVFLSNIIYAMLAISILSGIYDSEAVLFDEGKGRMQLFERRKNIKRGGIIKTGDTWFLIVFVILAVIYAGGIFEMKYGLFGVFLTQMLILFIPLSVLVYTKKDLRKNYSVRKTKPLNVLYSFIFMAGIFLLNIPLTTFVTSVFPDNTKTVTDSLQSIMGSGFLVTVLVVCIVPGICEELFFRGVIFSSMKERYKPVTAIIITAACFGIYHTSIVRFFPTAFLGASLCIICYYTGSVFPGIIMHSLNNLTSVVAYYYPNTIRKFAPFLVKENECVKCIIPGLVLMILGFIMLKGKNKIIKSSES